MVPNHPAYLPIFSYRRMEREREREAMERELSARVDDTTTNRSVRFQAKLRGSARRQSITDGFPSSQHVRSQRRKLVLHERVQPNLRHERAVPAISGYVRALARERAEGARPCTRRAVREEIGEIEELAAFEAVGCHVMLQPENFWDFHLKLKRKIKEEWDPSPVSTRGYTGG
jgi:hypothetical protein